MVKFDVVKFDIVKFDIAAIASSTLAVLYTQADLSARPIVCDLHSHSPTG